MVTVELQYKHIAVDENAVPIIAGTNMKVIELVMEHLSYGWSSEELHFQHPYLSMGQIHSALAYYWDNQTELDRDIGRRLDAVDKLAKTLSPSPLVTKLKAKGLI